MNKYIKILIILIWAAPFTQAASYSSSSSSSSFFDPNYSPIHSAVKKEIIGKYQELFVYNNGSTMKIDLSIEENNIATVQFETIPTSGVKYKIISIFKGTWNIRNGWIDLKYGNNSVTSKVVPDITTRTAKGNQTGFGLQGAHALRSSERLLAAKLLKI